MGILSGLGGLAGGAIGAWATMKQAKIEAETQRQNVDRTIEANKGLAEYQYSKDLEMWQRQNQYNSPEQQMQRLESAGLNPNMAYGSGSVAGNTSAQMPKYNAPRVDYNYKPPVNLPDMLGQFTQLVRFNAEMDSLTEIRNFNAYKAKNEYLNTLLKTQQLNKGDLDVSLQRELWKSNLAQGMAEADKSQWEAKLRREQVEGASLGNVEKMADILYKQRRNDWMAMGVTTSDDWRLRQFATAVLKTGAWTKEEIQSFYKNQSNIKQSTKPQENRRINQNAPYFPKWRVPRPYGRNKYIGGELGEIGY